MIIKPLKGNNLDLKGSVKAEVKPINFKKLRIETKKKVARKIDEHVKSQDFDSYSL